MTWLDYLVEVPYKSEERLMVATENSEFKQTLGSVYSCNRDGQILHTVPTSVVWYIDNNRVSRETFGDVIKRLELMIYSKTKRRYVWKTLNGSDGVTVWKIEEPEIAEPISKEKLRSGIFTTITPGEEQVMARLWTDYLKEIDNPVKVTFKNGAAIKVEKDTQPTVKYGFDTYGDHFYCGKKAVFSVIDDTAFCNNKGLEVPYSVEDFLAMLCGESNTKENEDMVDYKKIKDDIFKEYSTAVNKHFMMRPQIVNYQYNEETGKTTVYWDDKTQTTVTADNVSEASQFEGFCAACAKKLFGNKSTYLNQFDKWTVKIPARQKAEAEKKAAEDKAREEARAKRAAKKAERKAKRDIEIRAKQLADEYYAQEIEDEAEKIAHEKYGVPKNWFDGYSED